MPKKTDDETAEELICEMNLACQHLADEIEDCSMVEMEVTIHHKFDKDQSFTMRKEFTPSEEV